MKFHTQLLIDGQRIPPGFSLESLTSEQVERIEILRAPTADTGARATAGTRSSSGLPRMAINR